MNYKKQMRSMSASGSSAYANNLNNNEQENEAWKKTVVPFHDPHKALSRFEVVRRIFRGCAYQNFYSAVTAIAFMFNCWAQLKLHRQYFWRYARMSFYSLCLLDICVRNASLERVLAAVKLNRSQLGQTALLMIVLIYIYTTFIFWSFKNDFIDGSTNSNGGGSYERCQTIAQCLVTAYDEGLRQDVGLAEYLVGLKTYGDNARPTYVIALRLLFDVGWWVAITLLLVNIVAGVIIDAFAELRDTDKRLQSMLDTKCLVCGCDASDLNTKGSGYRSHLKKEHNLWNYVWLRLALRTKVESGLSKKMGKSSLYGKRSTEFTGQESYVWSMIEDDDRAYLPQRQAMCFLPSNSINAFNTIGGNGNGGSEGNGNDIPSHRNRP
jgi:inositol 1,4,5-triphosphate receptor type 1